MHRCRVIFWQIYFLYSHAIYRFTGIYLFFYLFIFLFFSLYIYPFLNHYGKLIKLLEYSKICIASNFEFFRIKRYKKCKQAFLRCNKITTKASKRDENPQLYAHLSIVVYICEHTGQFSTFVNRHIIGKKLWDSYSCIKTAFYTKFVCFEKIDLHQCRSFWKIKSTGYMKHQSSTTITSANGITSLSCLYIVAMNVIFL